MAKHYKNNNNLITAIIAIFVAIVLGVGVLIIGYVSRNDEGKWFANSDLASWHWSDNKTNAENNGGNNNGGNTDNGNNGGDVTEKMQSNVVISETSNSGVNVYSAVLPRSAYAANGISELADTAIKLTATIKPDYAYNKSVEWSINWQNSSSSWAQGKEVTDYVEIDLISELEANAICLQAFGEPIEITCSVKGTDIKAICRADYVKKVTDINVVSGLTEQADGSYLWVWNSYELNENIYGKSPAPSLKFSTVCDSTGTKEVDNANQSVKIEFSSELITALNPTKTSETYSGLTLDGAKLFYLSNGGDDGFINSSVNGLTEWDDYDVILVRKGYATFLTKCLNSGVDFNVTVTAGNLTKTFNVNVVVAAESVDIPSDIEF